MRVCAYRGCNVRFKPKQTNQRFHEKACKDKERNRRRRDALALSKGQRAAVGRLIIARTLIEDGYDVFMPVERTAKASMLAIDEAGTVWFVVVRTGFILGENHLHADIPDQPVERNTLICVYSPSNEALKFIKQPAE